MRYITLVVSIVFTLNLSAQKNPCNPEGLPYSSLPGDTTITLPSGTTITFNRCEFFDLRDCIEIIEIVDTADLIVQNLTMYDNRGNALLTCGMLSIKLKDCGKPCFDVPIKIKVKIRFQDCSGTSNAIPNLYLSSGGSWQQVEKDKTKIVTENNERYFEFITKCPVTINCDVPKSGRKVKFIAPGGKKIVQLRLGTNCPLFFFDEIFSKQKRRIKVRLLCSQPENMRVQAKLYGADNKPMITDSKKLSELRHGNARVQCKKERNSFFDSLFGWLKKREGNFHKKYYL